MKCVLVINPLLNALSSAFESFRRSSDVGLVQGVSSTVSSPEVDEAKEAAAKARAENSAEGWGGPQMMGGTKPRSPRYFGMLEGGRYGREKVLASTFRVALALPWTGLLKIGLWA